MRIPRCCDQTASFWGLLRFFSSGRCFALLDERLSGLAAFVDLLFSGLDGREDVSDGFGGTWFALAFCVCGSVLLCLALGGTTSVGVCAGAGALLLAFDRRSSASGDALRALSASTLRFFVGREAATGRSSSSLSLSEAESELFVLDPFSFFHAIPFAFIVFCFVRLALIFASLACWVDMNTRASPTYRIYAPASPRVLRGCRRSPSPFLSPSPAPH